ncbi:hypothetical protein O3Q51_05970 [Cryomorphaceae bacterium 1068]|nr:hypothetical protein [Cryomorphaceae bacterium 1068]
MTATLWIGLGFLITLVIFLMLAFFFKNEISRQQYAILKFLIALSAGFSGGFLAGTAIFSLDGTLANGFKFAISGTSGVALFFTVWFYFPEYTQTIRNAFNYSVGENQLFGSTISTIAKSVNGFAEFTGFSEEDLQLPLESRQVNGKSALEGIKKLKYLNPSIPPYSVTQLEDLYKIEKTEQ